MQRADVTARWTAMTPALQWDAKQIKILLNFQIEKLSDRHLAFIEQQGGPEALIQRFLDYPLSAIQRRIVLLILAAPGEPQQQYSATLHVHRSTFSEWFNDLARRLACLLNATTWSMWLDQYPMSRADDTFHGRSLPATIIPFPGVESVHPPALAQIHHRLIEVHQAVQRVERRLEALQHDP